MNKSITTVYLDKTLVQLIHEEGCNLSELINTYLEQYLSASSTEQIDQRIEEYKQKILVLQQKRESMVAQGISENKMDGIKTGIMDVMQRTYKIRQEHGRNRSLDEDWITSPKNIQKCKLLGMDPLVVLHELGEWYENQC